MHALMSTSLVADVLQAVMHTEEVQLKAFVAVNPFLFRLGNCQGASLWSLKAGRHACGCINHLLQLYSSALRCKCDRRSPILALSVRKQMPVVSLPCVHESGWRGHEHSALIAEHAHATQYCQCFWPP